MAQLLMLYLGSLMIRSLGIALIAGICSWKLRNVAMRHAVWVAVLGAVLLLPFFDSFLPASWVPGRMQKTATEQIVTFRAASRDSSNMPTVWESPAPMAPGLSVPIPQADWWGVAALLYVLMALAMFARLVMGYRRIWNLLRAGKVTTTATWKEILASHRPRWRNPILLESQEVQVPMTIGFFRPAVILPADWKDWDDWKLRAVLLHEIAHVRRGDWGIAAVVAVVKCAYWLNPLVWFLERQLAELAEQASDDASIAWTHDTTRYAEVLLEFAAAAQNGRRFMGRGVAMAQYKIQSRIERVLSNRKSGTGILKIAGWMAVLLLATPVIYSAAALQVASRRETVVAPQHSAVFAQPALFQAVPSEPQSRAQSAPAALPRIGSRPSNQAADLQDLFQLELQQQVQRNYEVIQQKLAEAQLQVDLTNLSQTPASVTGSTEFVTIETAKLQRQLESLQAQMKELLIQTAKPQQDNRANNPPAVGGAVLDLPDALLDLPGNENDLLAYLTELARSRGVSAGVNPSNQKGKTDSPSDGVYVIQPKDQLNVVVYKHADLSMKVTVQPDGLVSIPLVQSIQAAGLTPAELKRAIELRLRDSRLIDAPNVTVILESK